MVAPTGKKHKSATNVMRLQMLMYGQQLREYRMALGWSQAYVAELLGTTQSEISVIENGKNITLLTYIRLLDLYGKEMMIRNKWTLL